MTEEMCLVVIFYTNPRNRVCLLLKYLFLGHVLLNTNLMQKGWNLMQRARLSFLFVIPLNELREKRSYF